MTYAINATGPFYHGTRADLAVGDLLAPRHRPLRPHARHARQPAHRHIAPAPAP